MVTSVEAVERFVRRKGTVLTVEQDAKVVSAARKMRDNQVGCLVVVDADGRMAGILSERDVLAKIVAKGLDPADVCVKDVMSRRVNVVGMSTTIEEAGRIMARLSIRHLPIVENGVPLGMISSRDILAHQLSIANAQARKGRRILQDLEDRHPGITQLQTDNSGRIVI